MWCLTLFLLLYFAVRSAEKLAYIIEIENPTAFLTEHPEAHVRQTFNSTILRGVSASFDSAEHGNRSIRDPLVIQSWPITRYSRPMSSNFIRQVPVSNKLLLCKQSFSNFWYTLIISLLLLCYQTLLGGYPKFDCSELGISATQTQWQWHPHWYY